MKPLTAKKLLTLNYDLYEHQAQSFSQTRRGLWEKEMINFVKKIPISSSVLDLGCGNGRLLSQIILPQISQIEKEKLFKTKNYSGVLQNIGISYLGIDSSKQFIKINQKEYGHKLFKTGNGLTMKFKNKFDYIISISVLHHIPSDKLQLKFLTNCRQALKPNGIIYLVLWNRWQSRFQKYLNIKKPFSGMDYNDTIVPWMHSKYQRYIHLFKPTELKSLAQKAGFKNARCFASRHGVKTTLSKALNIYLMAEK